MNAIDLYTIQLQELFCILLALRARRVKPWTKKYEAKEERLHFAVVDLNVTTKTILNIKH